MYWFLVIYSEVSEFLVPWYSCLFRDRPLFQIANRFIVFGNIKSHRVLIDIVDVPPVLFIPEQHEDRYTSKRKPEGVCQFYELVGVRVI